VYAKAGKQGAITFFLAIGPHEHGQSSAILPSILALFSSILALFSSI
jgi:hypothetical protein